MGFSGFVLRGRLPLGLAVRHMATVTTLPLHIVLEIAWEYVGTILPPVM